jgi:hypothetical protein
MGMPAAFADAPVNPYSYRQDTYMPIASDQMQRGLNLEQSLNNPLPQIASVNPAQIIDKYGNTSVYFNGKIKYVTAPDGTTTYYRGGLKAFTRNRNGYLFKRYEWNNSGEATVKNEWGEVTGFEQFGLGGKQVSELDSHRNITKKYEYDGRTTWEYDFINQIWKRSENGEVQEERRASKSGPLVAIWRRDGDSVWRIEITVDIDGNPMEGNRTRYDKNGVYPQEVFNAEGGLVMTYYWENYKLQKTVNHLTGDVQLYGEFGVSEEGFLDEDGQYYTIWKYEWQGSRMLSAFNLWNGEVKYYDADQRMNTTWVRITAKNIETLKVLYGDDIEEGDEFLIGQAVYFYEIENMTAEQLKEYFHISNDDMVEILMQTIEDFKAQNKASAGLFAMVNYSEYTPEDSDQSVLYMASMSIYNAYNLAQVNILGDDVGRLADFYLRLAEQALTDENYRLAYEQADAVFRLFCYVPGADATLPDNIANNSQYARIFGQALWVAGKSCKGQENMETAHVFFQKIVDYFSSSDDVELQQLVALALAEL